MQNEIDYNFGPGENFSHAVMRAREVELASTSAGIYAWYLRVPVNASNKTAQYTNLLSQYDIALSGSTSSFGESYQGRLGRVRPQSKAFVAESLLAAASAVLSPPIYIGISVNLRRRLKEHMAELDAALWDLPSDQTPQPLADDELDTSVESKSFALRVATLLREQHIRDTRWLFVKLVYAADEPRSNLVDVEHTLNRAYFPLCGRR